MRPVPASLAQDDAARRRDRAADRRGGRRAAGRRRRRRLPRHGHLAAGRGGDARERARRDGGRARRRRRPTLRANQTLEQALGALLRERTGLPVVEPDTRAVVGWLTHVDVLRAYNARLELRLQRASPGRRVQREIGPIGTARARLRGYRVVDLELSREAPPVGADRSATSTGRRRRRSSSSAAATTRSTRRTGLVLARGDRLDVLVPPPYADEPSSDRLLVEHD